MSIKLIVGLQNPGKQYDSTRHNAGAWFVQALLSRCKADVKAESKFHGLFANATCQEHPFKTLLPTSFMNRSGQSIKSVMQFYKIDLSEILVVHDELDLDPGRIKLKTGGGHGGHNGLRDTIMQLGSNEFHRLRIGIGHPGHKDLVTPFVLGKPNLQDKQRIYDAIERGLHCIPILLSDTIAAAMNQLNA